MTVGQVNVFGEVEGLDSLVSPPRVLELDGLKVISFTVSESDKNINGYVDTIKEKARRLEPEVKSRGKPYFLTAAYQTKLRKKKAGVL